MSKCEKCAKYPCKYIIYNMNEKEFGCIEFIDKRIEKELKAFEILKSQINLREDGTWYIDCDSYCFDTDGEENKIIKEVLKNGREN